MAEENYPQGANGDAKATTNSTPGAKMTFPYPNSAQRIQDYDYFTRLFMGEHWDAFNVKISDPMYNKNYQKLRYVKANFAGLISKVAADMLFSEPATFKCPDGDQDFLDALIRVNKLDTQNYESALSNSYNGDAVYKLRIGKINPGDEKPTVIIEDITPKIYFPKVDGFNVRSNPEQKELAWTFRKGNDVYLRRETHMPGKIYNQVYSIKGNVIENEVGLGVLGNSGIKPEEDVKIKDSLIVHVPNWKTGDRYFGISDYHDLDSLFFAVNNRMTKLDNILDKHSDPILMVPEGVLDENGKVKKQDGRVIELGEGENGKPEYIVWDASLENAFKQIEKLVEFIYLIGEVSPGLFGLGDGAVESGRALKLKLIRTVAKAARKKTYYNTALQEVLYTAQLLAKAYNVECDGLKLKKDPSAVEITFQDGIPVDEVEQTETEVKRVDAGLSSKKAAIMRIYGVDEKSAEKMLEEDRKENELSMPAMSTTSNFKPGDTPPTGKETPTPTPPGK